MMAVTGTSVLSWMLGLARIGSRSQEEIIPADYMTFERGQLAFELNLYNFCPVHQFSEMNFSGIAEGFVLTKTLKWEYYDVTGFIGYIDSRETIYVSMRGTMTKPNDDMNWDNTMTGYTTWPECDCRVHRGVDRGVNGVYP